MIYCKRDENNFIHGDQLMILGCQMVSFKVMKDVEEQEGTAMTQWDEIHYTDSPLDKLYNIHLKGGEGKWGIWLPFSILWT